MKVKSVTNTGKEDTYSCPHYTLEAILSRPIITSVTLNYDDGSTLTYTELKESK